MSIFTIRQTCLCAVLFLLSFNAKSQDALQITREMVAVSKSVNSLKYTCESNERVKGKLRFESSDFKISMKPFKIYVYRNTPDKGIECLFATNENNNNAKINPNAFPWVSLNLNPNGDLVLENRHHTIFDAGFDYTLSLLQFLMDKYAQDINKNLTYEGIVKVANMDCYHLVFNNPNYKLTLYTVKDAGETPQTIAKKLRINFYEIMENNSGYKPSDVVKPGTKLIVPNDYASKMEIYVHKDKKYPVYIKVYDPKSLFEEFKFLKMELNPTFNTSDFSAVNPQYHFK